MTTSSGQEWRAEPPPEAWDRVRAEDTRRRRAALILAGVLAIAVGLVAILVPAVASVGTAIFTGIVLLVAGAAIALDALAAEGGRHRLLRGLGALATFAAGIYLLAAPLEGTFTLTVILVIWFVAIGAAQVATGAVAAGLASVALGVLIAVELPSSADWAIGLLVGINFIVYGLLSLGRAFRL